MGCAGGVPPGCAVGVPPGWVVAIGVGLAVGTAEPAAVAVAVGLPLPACAVAVPDTCVLFGVAVDEVAGLPFPSPSSVFNAPCRVAVTSTDG